MKSRHRLLLPALTLLLCGSLSLAPAGAEEIGGPVKEYVAKNGKKKKKKKKNKDKKNPEAKISKEAGPVASTPAADAKQVIEAPPVKAAASNGNFCEWLQNSPGKLYRNKDSWLINSFTVGGRFHYQAAYMEGKDFRGHRFHDTYDEYRRARLAASLGFLRYFKLSSEITLVDDRRFRKSYPDELDWGYQTFDTLTLTADLDSAFDLKWLDKLHLSYGRMKLRMGTESHMSSNKILTIERSAMSGNIASEAHRVTGAMLVAAKGNWQTALGLFSNRDNSKPLQTWGNGVIYNANVTWKPTQHWSIALDYVSGDRHGSGINPAIEYAWASSLSATYDAGPWGVVLDTAYGDNGGLKEGHANARRQGDFWGAVVMPWYWIVKDRLQLVAAWQYVGAERSEGIRLNARYLDARHDDPLVNVRNAYGDRAHEFYLGLNYYLCGQNAKIMGGVTRTNLHTRSGGLSTWTYALAFRTWF